MFAAIVMCSTAPASVVEETVGTLKHGRLQATSKQYGRLKATLAGSEFSPAVPATGGLRVWEPIGASLGELDANWPDFALAEENTIWSDGEDEGDGVWNISQSALVVGFTDQYGAEWTRLELIKALADNPYFGGSIKSATKAFQATFENPNIVVTSEAKDKVVEVLNQLGTAPEGVYLDEPTTQPAQVEIEFEGEVSVGYGPLAVKGKYKYKLKGTPEQFRAHLDSLWEWVKGVLNDIATKFRQLWILMFGSAPPQQQ